MGLETRHTEKNVLFSLLCVKEDMGSLERAISQLVATMEPDDVELVKKQVSDLKSSTPKEGK